MRRVLTPGAANRVVEFMAAGHQDRDEDGGAELKVGGRRYRLVPVDSLNATESADASASVATVLTPRELQIVALVAEGLVNKQVADVLHISEWTVSTHLRRVFAKLGVDTRAAMVSRCFGMIVASRK
jgi:DNA-binding CsgD family transcriptional regulator